MPCRVIQRLVVTDVAPQFSRPIIVGDGNAAFVTAVCSSLSGGGATLNLKMEVGNGSEGWMLVGSDPLVLIATAPADGKGAIAPLATIVPPNNVTIGARFARVGLYVRGTGTAVVDIILRVARV